MPMLLGFPISSNIYPRAASTLGQHSPLQSWRTVRSWRSKGFVQGLLDVTLATIGDLLEQLSPYVSKEALMKMGDGSAKQEVHASQPPAFLPDTQVDESGDAAVDEDIPSEDTVQSPSKSVAAEMAELAIVPYVAPVVGDHGGGKKQGKSAVEPKAKALPEPKGKSKAQQPKGKSKAQQLKGKSKAQQPKRKSKAQHRCGRVYHAAISHKLYSRRSHAQKPLHRWMVFWPWSIAYLSKGDPLGFHSL